MKYNSEELERIKKECSLSIVVGTYISLKQEGGELKGLCPFHREKTPSFTIRKENGIELFHCFGCNKNGNVFQFLMNLDNKLTFNEAVEKATQLCSWEKGKEEVEKSFKPLIEDNQKKITFPLEKLLVAEKALEENSEALAWLKGRGISLDTAKRFHLGYVQTCIAAPPDHPWIDKGWIIFPSISGKIITLLKYRSILGKKTEDGKAGIVRKSGMVTSLFGADEIIPSDDCFIVEGEPDVLIMSQAGYRTLGLPGAGFSPTPEMRDTFIRAKNVYLAGDMDEVGRNTMNKLWKELQGSTYLIEWPEGCKDANDCFLKVCSGDIEKFKAKVEQLKQDARQRPIPGFYSMGEVIKKADTTNPMDAKDRLHFPWKNVDKMAVLRPGSVVSSFATQTGTGKTTFWLAVQLYEAISYGSTILNYSAELSPQELATLTTAILTKHDRLNLTKEHYAKAADIMKNVKFYIGYNPDVANIKDILGDGTDKHPGLMENAIRRFGANIVVLDHLHFFTSGEKEAINTEAAAMTRIKNLAVKYNIIFIVIGQSRKANQNNRGRVSELSDAKGSEAFSSTANTTYQLHRSVKDDIDINNPPEDILDPLTSIRLYKCRTKGPGSAFTQLMFEGITGRFVEVIPDPVKDEESSL